MASRKKSQRAVSGPMKFVESIVPKAMTSVFRKVEKIKELANEVQEIAFATGLESATIAEQGKAAKASKPKRGGKKSKAENAAQMVPMIPGTAPKRGRRRKTPDLSGLKGFGGFMGSAITGEA